MTANPRDQHIAPTIDTDSQRILEAAIETLGKIRGLPWLGDAGATLHLLASLIAETERRLPRAVADAREQEYSWAEIADLLGVTRASAWQRYARRTHANRTPLDPD
jgi:hypothetical protein